METIQTNLDPDSEDFKANSEHHRALANELRERLAEVRQGGGEKYRQRHESQGKLFVRDRIEGLLDGGEVVPGDPRLDPARHGEFVTLHDRADRGGCLLSQRRDSLRVAEQQ